MNAAALAAAGSAAGGHGKAAIQIPLHFIRTEHLNTVAPATFKGIAAVRLLTENDAGRLLIEIDGTVQSFARDAVAKLQTVFEF